LSGGQEGFDSFVLEDEQRSHRSEPGWERLVATGVADPADDLFLQITRGVAGAVLSALPWTSRQSGVAIIKKRPSHRDMPLSDRRSAQVRERPRQFHAGAAEGQGSLRFADVVVWGGCVPLEPLPLDADAIGHRV
jgi:hypothetical protein